jgi:hypothetical protein
MEELLKRVPKQLHDRFREIVGLTDQYCKAHMNAEYRDLCRKAAVEACRAKVPVESGKAAGWAAGVVSAVAFANFLGSDPGRPFHTPPDEMAKRLGVSPATMNNKSKAVRDALGIDRADTRFSTKDLNDRNPLNQLPELFAELMGRLGGPHGGGKPAARKGGKKPAKPAGPVKVYTLDVSLLAGPITKAFAKKNKSVVRTIEIRGDQTLEDLHEAIFDAFDRDDPHMYEFQFGKRPMDPKGPRYVMPEAVEDDDGFGPPVAGVTTESYIGNLGLKPKRSFGYWFDFGDDWHHQIDVVSISDGPPKGKYPRVTHRVGESPPQYVDWDEEE